MGYAVETVNTLDIFYKHLDLTCLFIYLFICVTPWCVTPTYLLMYLHTKFCIRLFTHFIYFFVLIRWFRRRCENNIKMHITETGCVDVDWIRITQYRQRWPIVVNAHNMRKISWLAEKLSAFQEWLTCIKPDSYLHFHKYIFLFILNVFKWFFLRIAVNSYSIDTNTRHRHDTHTRLSTGQRIRGADVNINWKSLRSGRGPLQTTTPQ